MVFNSSVEHKSRYGKQSAEEPEIVDRYRFRAPSIPIAKCREARKQLVEKYQPRLDEVDTLSDCSYAVLIAQVMEAIKEHNSVYTKDPIVLRKRKSRLQLLYTDSK